MDILFDLDGTLTDPVLGITRGIHHALVNLGRTAPDLDSLRRFVGPPLQVRHVLAEEGIPPERAWMVGDRMHDVIGARRNGVEAIGVLWGYGSEEELRAAAPRRIVASMEELCEAIQMERRPRQGEAEAS